MKLSKERIEELIESFDCDLETEAALRELLALRRQNEWQPIETAPTQTDVLICSVGWASGAEARLHDEEGWYAAGNHPTDSWGGQLYPSHWMPLPPAPIPLEAQKESGE